MAGPEEDADEDANGAASLGGAPARSRWRTWRHRLAKPGRRIVILLILAAVVEYLVVPELVHASKDVYLLGRIDLWWVVLGTALEGLSLFCYAILTKVLLPPGPKPSLSRLFRIDLSAAAVAHVIPAGTLGTAALGFRLFTNEGISGNDAAVMMAAKGVGSTVVLNVLLLVSLVISIGLSGFRSTYATITIVGTIVLAGAAALVLGVARGGGVASRALRVIGDKTPGLSGDRLEHAVLAARDSFSLLARDKRIMSWALVWASLNWLLDAAALWCFVAAFGSFINPVELFAAYGIGNVAGALPITPGGLGVVDSITPVLLVGFGATSSVATLGVLGWRVVNFWLPIPTGAAAYVSLKVSPSSGVGATIRSVASSLFSSRKADSDGGPEPSADEARSPHEVELTPGEPRPPADGEQARHEVELSADGSGSSPDGHDPRHEAELPPGQSPLSRGKRDPRN
ncbi:MAG TPA: YbhN family protein [Trebonia sp.]|nr:YbhN family protein [Trebonia sp.]